MLKRTLCSCICGLVIALGLVAAPGVAVAHGGGLNAEGCHHDRKRGGYHCHRAPSGGWAAPRPLSSPKATFANCAAARAAGAAPLRRGEPGYGRHLDRDDDGVACESGGGGGRAASGRGETARRAMPFAGAGVSGVSSSTPARATPSTTNSPKFDAALNPLPASQRTSAVIRLQQMLTEGGYNPGPIDGQMGAQTRAALARLQAEMNLAGAGHLDDMPIDALGPAQAEPAPAEELTVATGATLVDPVWLSQPSDLDLARQYPDRAQRTGVTGQAVIACLITATGALTACEILSETPEGHGFGDAALRLARHYRAHVPPGHAGARVELPVAFALPD